MGTRSLTFVQNAVSVDNPKAKPFTCMYRQFDGYPSGHGKELAEWLNGIQMVDGIPCTPKGETPVRMANGAGCLAAQMFAHFKDGPGGIYCYPPNSKDVWEEYAYEIHVHETFIIVKCSEVAGKKRKLVFEGNVSGFLLFCTKEE